MDQEINIYKINIGVKSNRGKYIIKTLFYTLSITANNNLLRRFASNRFQLINSWNGRQTGKVRH